MIGQKDSLPGGGEALGGIVPVFKPQSAFFEAYGAAGIAVLERTLADIKAAGAISLLDVKRGDIGSTMDAYAAAYLSDGSPLAPVSESRGPTPSRPRTATRSRRSSARAMPSFNGETTARSASRK